MADTATPVVENEGKDVTMSVDALNLLAQGKRNFVCGEVQYAVTHLQEACRLLAEKYGETADECADAYFTYGSALLELSRMESGVLGNALQGIESEEDEEGEKSAESGDDKLEDESDKMTEEQKEKLSEDIVEAMLETDDEVADRLKKEVTAQNGKEAEIGEKTKDVTDETPEKLETPTEEKVTESDKVKENDVEVATGTESADDKEPTTAAGDTEEEGGSEDIEDEEGNTEEGEEGEEKKEEEAGPSEKKESDDEDISNLQLSWEMLELAKVIYKRQDKKEMKLRFAESHLKLGEVGLETEQYEQAISDFEACLRIQKSLLEPENRLLAETFYQLGLACTFDKRYEAAIENYNSAINVIKTKLAKLHVVLDEGEKAGKGKDLVDFDDPVYKARKEVTDLEGILPDIFGKIEDVEDEKKNAEKVKNMLIENVSSEFGTTTTGFGASTETTTETTANKVASDITHLVRKKRKPEEDLPKEDSEAEKKVKTDGSGDAVATHVNGNSNETKESPEKPMEEDTEVKTKTVEDVKKLSQVASETS